MHVCIYIYIYVYVNVYIYNTHTHTYIYIYIYMFFVFAVCPTQVRKGARDASGIASALRCDATTLDAIERVVRHLKVLETEFSGI